MRGIKIPLQDFVLKMQGGLMREGGRICGTLRYYGEAVYIAMYRSLMLNLFAATCVHLDNPSAPHSSLKLIPFHPLPHYYITVTKLKFKVLRKY